ncbi:MAG: hypothetical protein ACREBE_20820, partial [bacterium]
MTTSVPRAAGGAYTPQLSSLPVAAPRARGGRTARDLLLDLLDTHVADAAIHFILDGQDVVVGNPACDGPDSVVLQVHRERFFARVLGEGNLG